MYGKGRVELLADRTFLDYNVRVEDIPAGSHRKVFVRCLRCQEEFLREFRNLHQLHACPTHIVRSDGEKLKWCNQCAQFLTYNSFGNNTARFDGLNSICSTCLANAPSRRKMHDAFKRSRTTPHGWMRWALSRKFSECKKSGIEFDIDIEYLLKQYDSQNAKCYYARIPLEFGTKNLRSASLERISPNLGYVRGNTVLACKAMNWAKNESSQSEFMEFILEVINSLQTYTRLECKIIHSSGQLPFRKRTSDAGYDVHSVEDKIIQPHSSESIDTGIIVCPPENTYYTIEGRSSVFLDGVTPYRGIIDGTYQGPLKVILKNNSDVPYAVKSGARIAQLVLHNIINGDFINVDDFTPVDGGRSADGWGSSGK